jgi:hypothetical protein
VFAGVRDCLILRNWLMLGDCSATPEELLSRGKKAFVARRQHLECTTRLVIGLNRVQRNAKVDFLAKVNAQFLAQQG